MQLPTATSTHLLDGLKDQGNQIVWAQYVDRYRPMIVGYCGRLGIAAHDAEDVAQEALVAFAKRYREGDYDRARGRLRAWLFGIVHTEIARWRRAVGRTAAQAAGGHTAALAGVPDQDRLAALWEEEWRAAVVRQCMALARAEVGEKTFAAFELFACESWPAKRVAEHLGTTEGAVFVAKHRVLRRIRELHPQLDPGRRLRVVACPSEEQLAAFAAGACVAEESSSIGAHLEDCARCSAWLHEASADDVWVDAVRGALAHGRCTPPRLEPWQTGDRIAGFRLVREIGEGGMSVVYEAEQDSPRRPVALKLILPGVASRRTLRRFEHEAEVLGRLQHPGVAQIFAAGTFESGRGAQPFFAMELVRGQSLLEHARSHALDVRARLALFLRICDAVHHAHQKGVLHRDLKPSNILVDEKCGPKVLDFGVARVLETVTERGALDTLSGQVVGTLPYMSPEQVVGSADLDVRSDVYTLGVVLYQLLTGRLPYRPQTDSVADRARAIAEQPHVPLSASDRSLRGDLERVTGKALAKERERRYGSALELAQDVQRFLRAEPILARPPSTAYQLRLFARRHRGLVGAAVTVVAVLVGGIVVSWREARRAEAQRIEAVAARDFLQEVLVQASPLERDGKEASMRDVLELALQRVDRHLMEVPGAEAGVRHTLGRVQLALGLYGEAKEQLARAAELYECEAADDVQLVYVLADLAGAQEKLGELDAAERTVGKACDLRSALGTRHAFILGHAAAQLGISHYAHGRLAEAEQSFRAALADHGRIEEGGKREANVAETKGLLALVLHARGQPDEAERLYRESIEAQRARGSRSWVLATNLANFAVALAGRGAYAEAMALQREALQLDVANFGAEHENTWFRRCEIGVLQFRMGDREAGLQAVGGALAALRQRLGPHPRVVQTLIELAELQLENGDGASAEGSLRAAMAMGSDKMGPRHFLTNRARQRLGRFLLDAEQATEALEHLDLAFTITREDRATIPGPLAHTAAMLGSALTSLGRHAAAEQLLESLLSAAEPQPTRRQGGRWAARPRSRKP